MTVEERSRATRATQRPSVVAQPADLEAMFRTGSEDAGQDDDADRRTRADETAAGWAACSG
ncbi:hypothetical protein ACIPSA_30310 [Streptomyces sp. NPDC086549]|uniref:hypothetical protein n=1 Tax=Streptomyces sp. NPDC086549 TaxID=3365752 RepID=UPI003813FF0A